MPQLTEWEVDLNITGPFSVRAILNLDVVKGFDNPFWTNVQIKKASHGALLTVITRAGNLEEANDAAIYFVDQMLDLLCLRIDLPLYLGLSSQTDPGDMQVRRLISKPEWEEAFGLSRTYTVHRPVFTRALGWYRKGRTTENPIDKFMAFWLSLESIGSKYSQANERTKRGAINQVCYCFDHLWGDFTQWKVIANDETAVNNFYDLRNKIAHGSMEINLESIREVASELPKLKQLTHTFLSDWETRGMDHDPRN